MKLRKFKQSVWTPLVLLIMIMSITVISSKKNQSRKQQDTPKNVQTSEEPVQTNHPTEEKKTAAEIALADGKGIKDTVDSDYAREVIEQYCKRRAVPCSSTNLKREHDKLGFKQSFDQLSGYMTLAKFKATKDTTLECTIDAIPENATMILVFEDSSYVVLTEKEIQCPIPKGNTIALYIGENISGDVAIKLSDNKEITATHM